MIISLNLKNQNIKQIYNFDNIKLIIEVHKNFFQNFKNKSNTIFAILDGSLSDKYGRDVLSYGDIVRTNDFKVLSKVFKIKKQISVVKVYKS